MRIYAEVPGHGTTDDETNILIKVPKTWLNLMPGDGDYELSVDLEVAKDIRRMLDKSIEWVEGGLAE